MLGNKRIRPLLKLPLALLGSLIGWLLIAPIALLIPKRKDWVAVIGRQNGQFLDNAKYFFLQADANEPSMRFVFITERIDVINNIQKHGLEAIRYPSLQGAWFMLRCSAVVVDESNWFRCGRRFFLIRHTIIQLWHGVGFKRIEQDRWKNETGSNSWATQAAVVQLRKLYYFFVGRWVKYSAVVTTSHFYRDNVFSNAFLADRFPVTGYPRNDFAQSLTGKHLELAWSNIDNNIKKSLPDWIKQGKRLILIAPTFRDSGSVPMQLDRETLDEINAFAEKNNIEFIFKFHPLEKNTDNVSGNHFHICARDSDIYPLFPYFSALVTDYSSIGMDFLLVDKPILYFIPENDDYVEKDRELQFDPHSMMPGPVFPDWASLQIALLNEWSQDNYASERASLLSKAFDDLPQSEATSQLISIMREKGWVK